MKRAPVAGAQRGTPPGMRGSPWTRSATRKIPRHFLDCSGQIGKLGNVSSVPTKHGDFKY